MKIFTHNFNPKSNSGPNKFTRQLFNQVTHNNDAMLTANQQDADVEFCLIQQQVHKVKPMLLRLDGIYFNSEQDYNLQNAPIKYAYNNADAVIFQSEFNKRLTEHWFGYHKNSHVIHNAPDNNIINHPSIAEYSKKITWPWKEGTEVWSCASSWRPHKRLRENIRYFLEFAPKDTVLAIAGSGITTEDVSYSSDPRIYFFGELEYEQLLCLYQTSKWFIHLAYIDHCPNVVIDAQASGCKIVCSGTGGTSEIVDNGKVVNEQIWDYSPIKLYKPPRMNFKNIIEVETVYSKNSKPCIEECSNKYYKILKSII